MLSDEDIGSRWKRLTERLGGAFGKKPDLNAVLFLIGVQELGKGAGNYTKEQKQDLMHVGTCKVLSLSGYYELEGLDAEGWPLWQAKEKLPALTLKEQETFLKYHIVEYFEQEIFPHENHHL